MGDQTPFIGEHLLWGNLGHFSIVLALVTALLATFSFFSGARSEENKLSWYKMGRWIFYLHFAAVLTTFFCLYTIIQNHYYEYQYAWKHSSNSLPSEYMLSCFWEGQEGSFLLWIFWEAFLGLLVLVSVNKWTNWVMGVVALCQVVLCSMLLGIEIPGYVIGSSPFNLLRQSKEMAGAPIFQLPNYLEKIKDGNGLNPLLQNYWMVIHPPTLFLGFASLVMPFAYALAALARKEYDEWIKPALPWALFGLMVLGTGIMMGGMWAYESLNFGGYWAWDPVENASLIPWLFLAAGTHALLIARATGHSLKAAFLFIILAFLMVLYATFLTRSGILGDTSVHAFTDLGMSGQLLIFLLIFVFLALGLYLIRYREIPTPEKEQAFYSREFWMFVGALLLLLSAIQVVFTTSYPVFNKVLGTSLAAPTNVVHFYNSIQLPIAVFVALLTALAQYLRFKTSSWKQYRLTLLIHLLGALVLTAVSAWYMEIAEPMMMLLLLAGYYALVANAGYAIQVMKGRLKMAGASIAHLGFGMMLVGIVFSGYKQRVISLNQTGQSLGFDTKDSRQNKENFENVYLERGKPAQMDEYRITYLGDSVVEPNHFYKVQYELMDVGGQVKETFRLYPNVQFNPKMGLVKNPDTRHYLTHDVFTHVTFAPDRSQETDADKFGDPIEYQLKAGDSVLMANNSLLIFEGINKNVSQAESNGLKGEIMVGAKLRIRTLNGDIQAQPLYIIMEGNVYSPEFTVENAGLKMQFKEIDPSTGKCTFRVAEEKTSDDFIIMKAIVFPGINLLWVGTVIMVIGFMLALLNRVKIYRKSQLPAA